MEVNSTSGVTHQVQSVASKPAPVVQNQDADNDGDNDKGGVEAAGENGNNNDQTPIPGLTGNNLNVTI